MVSRRVFRVDSSYVPPDQMIRKSWFASGHGDWYYHAPRKTVSFPTTPDLLKKTADPEVWPVIQRAYAIGARTSPSCAGHFPTSEDRRRAWQHIREDVRRARQEGLKLHDVETGHQMVIKDKSFPLPFRDLQAFERHVHDHQGEGYIGIVLSCPVGAVALAQIISHVVPGAIAESLLLGDTPVVGVSIKTSDETRQRASWKALEKLMGARSNPRHESGLGRASPFDEALRGYLSDGLPSDADRVLWLSTLAAREGRTEDFAPVLAAMRRDVLESVLSQAGLPVGETMTLRSPKQSAGQTWLYWQDSRSRVALPRDLAMIRFKPGSFVIDEFRQARIISPEDQSGESARGRVFRELLADMRFETVVEALIDAGLEHGDKMSVDRIDESSWSYLSIERNKKGATVTNGIFEFSGDTPGVHSFRYGSNALPPDSPSPRK